MIKEVCLSRPVLDGILQAQPGLSSEACCAVDNIVNVYSNYADMLLFSIAHLLTRNKNVLFLSGFQWNEMFEVFLFGEI